MEYDGLQLLPLFDLYWFQRHVLLNSPLPPTHNSDLVSAAPVAEASSAEEPQLRRPKSGHRRSLSDEPAFAFASDSALLAHRSLMLQTILSGKVASEEEAEHREVVAEVGGGREKEEAPGDAANKRYRERRRRTREASRGGGESRSLSELEFEELKGLMDLGFTFSEAESDERLLSIVPGLQRLGRRRASAEEGVSAEAEEGEAGAGQPAVSRPYLSEAWDVAYFEESRRGHAHDDLLRNWKVPAAGEGVDMKGHLRSWAHTVASAVR